MKVVGISGSPRKRGNTEFLVKRALELCESQAMEVEFIPLAGKKITKCKACYMCTKPSHPHCVYKDDAVAILESMVSADALIVGSPTYFASVSSHLKALFDRTLTLRAKDFKLSGKIGGAIAVGGSRNGGQEHVCSQIHNWMLLHEMMVVSDRRTAHFGGICVGRTPGAVLEDEVGLATVDNLAMKVCETLNRMKKE